MAAPNSALLKGLAKKLAPQVKDTRKFRLLRPLVMNAEDAQKVAHAFNSVRSVSQAENLTFAQFLVSVSEIGFGSTKLTPDQVRDAESTMAEIFATTGTGTTALVIAD